MVLLKFAYCTQIIPTEIDVYIVYNVNINFLVISSTQTLRHRLSGNTSVGCVCRCIDLVRLCWFRWQSDSGKRAFMLGAPKPASSSLIRGVRLISWHQRHPFLKESRRGPRHFGTAVCIWVATQRPNPHKKGIVLHSPGRWDERQIQISSTRNRTLNALITWAALK